MIEVEEMHRGLPGCQEIMEGVHEQRGKLQREVERYCGERGRLDGFYCR